MAKYRTNQDEEDLDEVEVVYVDEKGNTWTNRNIEDLIMGYRAFGEFVRVFRFYSDMFK